MMVIIKKMNYLNYIKDFSSILISFLNAKVLYKKLPVSEGRALIYQKLLLSNDIIDILELSKILKIHLKVII